MFKEENLYIENEKLVTEFAKKKVIDIEELDRVVFRTDYVRDKFSLLEYVERLEEIYKSKLTLGKKLNEYLKLENHEKRNLKYTNDTLKNHLYYYLGYMVTSLMRVLPKEERGFLFYNFGVYENEHLYAAYFELDTKIDLDLLDYEETINELLKIEGNGMLFRKTDNIYELILLKHGLSSMTVGDLIYNLDYKKISQQGIELPIVVGKDTENNDVVLDFAELTNMLILGEKGSGKSTFLYTFFLNLLYLYDESELSILLLDSTDKDTNRAFSRSPHFTGYHTDAQKYKEILQELHKELELRKAILAATKMENWNDVRNYLLEIKDLDSLKAFPWLLIVLDEFNTTLSTLAETCSEDELDEFHTLLRHAVLEGEKLGIKVVGVSSCGTEASIPEYFMDHADIKILLTADQATFESILGDKVARTPSRIGEFILNNHGDNQLVKGPNVGILAEDKLNFLIRTLSIDLADNADMESVYRSPNFAYACNRPKIDERNLLLKESNTMFDVKCDSPIFNIARDLLAGQFDSSKYK